MKILSISQLSLGFLSLASVLVGQTSCSNKHADNPAPACSIPATVSYKTDVWPILKNNCRDICHNPQRAANFANFNMDDFSLVYRYATTKPASSNLSYSYLVGTIRHESGYIGMPYNRAKLSDCDIAIIEAWVNAGAQNN